MIRPTPSARPSFRVADVPAYVRPASGFKVDLKLDSNECPTAATLMADLLNISPASVTNYPSTRSLEVVLAERSGADSERVILTAGADDALNRIILALVQSGRNIVTTTPTFEMIGVYARQAGGGVQAVPWMSGPMPVDELSAMVNEQTAAVFVVSPNNPTGAVASSHELARLRDHLPASCVLVLDAAYDEFADEPLAACAQQLHATFITRTFSKAYGLAGLRLGYAIASTPEMARWLRNVGQPYSVSAVSIELLARWLPKLDQLVPAIVSRVRIERGEIGNLLRSHGAEVMPTQANFVLAKVDDARMLTSALAARGIAVRSFPGRQELADYVRITCPADDYGCNRLLLALRESLSTIASRTKVECKAAISGISP